MESHHSYRFPFAKYPAVRLVLLLVAGILLDVCLQFALWIWIVLFVSFLSCYLYFEYSNYKSLSTRKYQACIGCYILAIILFGACWHAIQNRKLQSTPGIPPAFTWETLDLHGELEQISRSATGNYQLNIAIDSTVIFDSLVWRQSYKVRAVLDSGKETLLTSAGLGSRLDFRATVYPLEEKRNPYEFDYRQYLASQGIYNQVGIDTIYTIREADTGLNWNRLRQCVLDLIDLNFSGETASLGKALLIGYKNELSRDEKLAFSRAGLSHIMAVSGLHVGFILAPFWLLIPCFWTLRWGKQTGLVLLVLLLLIYAGLTGFTASVTRASITGGFIMYGRLFHKVRDSKNLTALAALIILLINPNEFFKIGFQLSFSAVYIILLTMPVINGWLPAWMRFRWYGKPVLIVLVSIVVQVGLFPLLSYYFGEFSLAGPLINALVVPPLVFLVPYALVLLPVSAFSPALGQWLNTPNQWFLHILDQVVETTSSIEGSWLITHISTPLIFLIWMSALFFLAVLNIPRLRWKYLSVFLALLCIQQGHEVQQKLNKPRLKITIFDVGQGDAALIKTPLEKHFLIDTGRWSPGYNSAKYVIIPHLKAIGVKKLDAVFLSHPHADHIGGIVELIQSIPIGTIYNSGFQYDSRLYRTYLKQAVDDNIPVVSLSAGEIVEMDPSMRILIYGPGPGRRGDDPNEHSLVMELIYGTTEFLFTGDAGQKQETRLLKNFGGLTDTDFLKVGHHGSNSSSSSVFLNTITPELAVVSLARNNRFGHPHPDAVRRLRQAQTHLYFTSLRGACLFSSDGDSIYRESWR